MKGLALLTGVAVVACFAYTVEAQSSPRFSPEGYCLEVAEYEGGDAAVYDGCMEIERSAYDKIIKKWEFFPKDIQKHCVNKAISYGESYSSLRVCLDSKIDETNVSK